MQPSTRLQLQRYFRPLDRFLRVRVGDARALGIRAEELDGLDADGWRRLVIERAVDGLDAPLEDALVEALFDLVLEVNPELELGRARLAGERTAGDSGGGAGRRGRAGRPRRDTLRDLRRVARSIELRLERHVVGQPAALEAVARSVRRAALGWSDSGPLGRLLLVGPTGTGKTSLAKALAEELGGTARLVRVDATEFGSGHEVAKLLGAPPGYVGHGEPGLLARGLERAAGGPFVLLVDEVEKAHGRLHDLLLQVLDEGRAADGHGRELDLRRAFVLLTSNAGSRELAAARDRLGFARGAQPNADDELVRRALAERFRPEFLGRIDEVVTFRDVDGAAARRIAENQLADLAARVRRAGHRVRFRASVARWLAERGLAAGDGARGIGQVLRREVEAPLAELCLEAGRGWFEGCIRGGELRFTR